MFLFVFFLGGGVCATPTVVFFHPKVHILPMSFDFYMYNPRNILSMC